MTPPATTGSRRVGGGKPLAPGQPSSQPSAPAQRLAVEPQGRAAIAVHLVQARVQRVGETFDDRRLVSAQRAAGHGIACRLIHPGGLYRGRPVTRLSTYFLPTLRDDPADAESVSHRLLTRAGMVRQLGAGLWTWLPAGHRVHAAVEQIVREEMNAVGAQELLMPVLQPAELWQKTGRYEIDELFKLERPQGLSPCSRVDARGEPDVPRRARGALLPRPCRSCSTTSRSRSGTRHARARACSGRASSR